jgi:hypothetical protein
VSPSASRLYQHDTAIERFGKPAATLHGHILMKQRNIYMTLGIGFMLGLAAAGLILKKTEQLGKPVEVLKVLEDQQAAWNKGSIEGFMEGYWNSPELTFRSGGDVTKGFDATLERYRKKYQQGGAEMGQLTFSELEVEPLSANLALVTGRWQLKRKADEPSGLFTLRLRFFPGQGWKIISDHTSAKEK